jgi:hypothetical protein
MGNGGRLRGRGGDIRKRSQQRPSLSRWSWGRRELQEAKGEREEELHCDGLRWRGLWLKK